MGGVKVVVDGLEKLDPSKRYVFISNHQSALDIPVIIAGLKHYCEFHCQKRVIHDPLFGWGISALGHIRIDRSNPRKARSSLDKAVMRLKKLNTSLILFPEGTRSTDGQLGEFKQGSFALALMAGVQVVPLTIKDAMLRLPKKSWRINPGTIYLQIGDPIDVTPQTTKAEICQKAYDAIKKSLT
jgi:1-acyl-sn-glycerol-3-phosphate acyltransferase